MYLLLSVLGVIAIILYRCYTGVIRTRNQLDEALSGIDVQLKRRADVVPNVLKIAQKFMTHEKKIFTDITQLRTQVLKQQVGTVQRFNSEEKLQALMKQFVVSVENYPQLKSNEAMVKAIETYNDTEDNIAASRRFYNSALRDLKNKTQIFPSSLFANCAGDRVNYVYFQATADERKPVDTDTYLK